MLVLTDHLQTDVCTINITGLLTLLFYAIRALQSMDTGGFFNTGESESKLCTQLTAVGAAEEEEKRR